MSNEHLILCGSARLSSRKKVWREAKLVHLRTGFGTGNVNLRISGITRPLVGNLTDLETDLLEIATYIYCADQAVTRGGLKRIDYGRSWYRTIRLEIPVRQPDFWSSAEVQEDLCRTLNDLSGDDFEFAFCPMTAQPSIEEYFEFSDEEIVDVDEVILFSGGLDSFAGTVQEALCQNRKVVLVSHRPVSMIDARQRDLVAAIGERVSDTRKKPVHVPVLVNAAEELSKDHTQRTRSFLYASLAAVIARRFGLNGIRFYENGVTGLNLPISPQVVSTRATRTTHPMVLSGYARLFPRVFQDRFSIENPFNWKTKTDILTEVKTAGYSSLCAYTSSCAHSWQRTRTHPHCGRCSQCVDRRLAAFAAGYGNDEDPSEMYELNILGDGVEGIDRALVESSLEMINRIQRIQTATQFCVEFPELSRIINHIDAPADDVAQAVHDLYKRHGDQIGGILDDLGRAAISQLRLGDLPPNCLLSMAFSSGREFPGEPATVAGIDGLVVDESTFSVTWQGRPPVEIGNKKEFRLLQELAKSPGRYVAHADLAKLLGGDAMDNITHIKSRLVKLIDANGHSDLAECIRTETGHYGLFLS